MSRHYLLRQLPASLLEAEFFRSEGLDLALAFETVAEWEIWGTNGKAQARRCKSGWVTHLAGFLSFGFTPPDGMYRLRQ